MLVIKQVVAVALFFVQVSETISKNVVIILADDLGREISVYNDPVCKTPNIEKLSERSVTFENAFTSVSSCSPSRSSLLTGLPTHTNGMFGLHNSEHHFNSFEAVRSLPTILKKHGIKTGIIGKKHVGPSSVYNFDFEETEENNSIMQVGRNITRIKLLVRKFLREAKNNFLLYVAFHDPHRCGHEKPEYGNFCEKFGTGEPGMGLIPDWKPTHYDPNQIKVPYYIPNTNEAKADLANYFTTISRLDQGKYWIDNGPSFPNGRTNAYDPGVREPFFISNPKEPQMWGKREDSYVSLLDVVPTVLEWFQIQYPNYKLFNKPVKLTGKSLLPLISSNKEKQDTEYVYYSHNLHEATMYYPMRSVRDKRYKLIHNLNYWAPFPIDQDFYLSPTFKGILNRTKNHEPLFWSKNLTTYYRRSEWELFDLLNDPAELTNIYTESSTAPISNKMKHIMFNWQNSTNDPWMCSPHFVLEEIRSEQLSALSQKTVVKLLQLSQ
ncbi:N-sulfoglucosamine sulfohydrolase-like isoform X1 [Leptotrombidium deliense]|uniref:N-sulfoglucosamine sulfohydrolase-like isoform X1 n=1 Tax=Leptotrombidium deliense TaxID=299467 RepID=A0A443SB56_9ACAR|nr:N-sulfoglucosamine sulfohydrolase-like isoform X1 [Leptotrombidium deliense]